MISRTGISHVIIRGVGRQILFEEREDYIFFISVLVRYTKKSDIDIFAYCLMDNHVHLLLYDSKMHLPQMMKQLEVCYAGYFNRKYDRIGHLFQGRYLSEPVDDQRYLLAVFRYILLNPQKAHICPAFEYEWSSIRQYGDASASVNTELLEMIIGSHEQYATFLDIVNDDVCMEYYSVKKDDEWAISRIRNYLEGQSPTTLRQYEKTERDDILRKLKAEGLSIRQLERLTGINRGTIQRA